MRNDNRVIFHLAAANPLSPELVASYAAGFDHEAVHAAVFERSRAEHRLAEPPRRALAQLALVGLALLAVGVASSFALGYRPPVDFFAAKKGPDWAFFGFQRAQKIAALHGLKVPRVTLAAQAREITSVRYGGKDHVLVVAPTRGGGYCFSWRGPYLSGSCVLTRTGAGTRPIDAHLPGDASGPIALYGSFLPAGGTKLELSYQDGVTDDIGAIRVSSPIDAGFFLYKIPASHRHPGHAPQTLSLLDASGHVIARATLPILGRH
jgi:hypothetical protein